MPLSPPAAPTFCVPVDDAGTTVAGPARAIGGGTLAVADGTLGGKLSADPSPSAPVRLTCVRASDGAILNLKATARSGNAFTVAVADGTTDLALAIGDTVDVTDSAAALADIHSAIGTLFASVTAIVPVANGAEVTANKGIANGYAGLDGSGKVPTGQLPASSGASLGANTFTDTQTIAPSVANEGNNALTMTLPAGQTGHALSVTLGGTEIFRMGTNGYFYVNNIIAYSGLVTIPGIKPDADDVRDSGSTTIRWANVWSAFLHGTLQTNPINDSAAPINSIYLSLDKIDLSGFAKACRKNSDGSVTVIG